ncbi:hypothetical protein HAX54_029380 [Datura stramonium]|uniref:Uncharacterized protein n=1 Tax=Datura stramonium TaxID=4076 RepID=A0ABS8SAA4_DATST|nr:hypothetical protein [Datura stramonium]
MVCDGWPLVAAAIKEREKREEGGGATEVGLDGVSMVFRRALLVVGRGRVCGGARCWFSGLIAGGIEGGLGVGLVVVTTAVTAKGPVEEDYFCSLYLSASSRSHELDDWPGVTSFLGINSWLDQFDEILEILQNSRSSVEHDETSANDAKL